MDPSTPSVINSVAMRYLCLLALTILALAGCRFGQLPNPNAKKAVDKYDGAALQDRVLTVNRMLAEREMRGQIDRSHFQREDTARLHQAAGQRP